MKVRQTVVPMKVRQTVVPMKVRQVVVVFREPDVNEFSRTGYRANLELVTRSGEWGDHIAEFTTVAGETVVIPMDTIARIELGAWTEHP